MYYTVMTIAIGMSPGIHLVDALRQRVPALSSMADRRRAHACKGFHQFSEIGVCHRPILRPG
jgi:hypothetical protein